ncbi:MAG: transposase [Mojavia pulchra JT2-VF2]|uniref:Transposase n=1 Tax=Mojavia pulchra JT2-VF2 TaxID=287848 RepID=A0A951Q304_9NOST|nr:transposase [Mojavia pulchra JT2-VF2]
MPGRQAEVFLESLLTIMGVELEVPDHSTLSRRLSKLSVELLVIRRSLIHNFYHSEERNMIHSGKFEKFFISIIIQVIARVNDEL